MASLSDPVSFTHGPSMANRCMLAPLTNQQSHPDGTLSDDEHRWLTMRGLGGFGLTMTCAAHVSATGQGFPGQLGIFDDRHLDGLTRLATDLNASGTVSYVQLHHAGSRSPEALIGTTPMAPSADAKTGARQMTTAEVEQLIADFVSAARRAERAGFHGVELHGAHGYVISHFLSPTMNQRDDRFGGSLENRSRVLFDVIDGIRATCGPDLALAVRLSPERFGQRIEEMCDVFARLVDGGKVDLIDMSLWDVRKEPEDEAHHGRTLTEVFGQLPRGEVRLGVAGKIHDPADAQWVLDQSVDVAVLGRVAILHHDYPRRATTDPAWTPRQAPVAVTDLDAEGVSPQFADYLAMNFPALVIH